MKVTVTFADTAVVVPCKAGWTVWDLVEQATRRYRRILEQHGERAVKTHHLEYAEGGILDMDDMLSDLVDDRDKVRRWRDTCSTRDAIHLVYLGSHSFVLSLLSSNPEHVAMLTILSVSPSLTLLFLVADTPLLVRSSSDSALAPPHEKTATPPPDHHSNASPEPVSTVSQSVFVVVDSTLTRTVEFLGDRGPLGIHVVPYCSSLSGRTLGLHIRGIEENSRSKRENIFQEDECIVQINDTPLQDKTFTQSQEVFRQAMTSSAICLEVLPVANKLRYEKSLIGHLFTGDGKDSSSAKAKSPMVVLRRPDTRAKTPEPAAVNTPSAEIQSGHGSLERVSPAPPARGASSSPTRSQSPLASRSPALPGLANLTSKKGGKRIKIDLKKGAEGLGFTVVTRDSSAHAPGPILVKNILPRGAAVNDGRLQPGDRILEVNGVDMTGRSQEELVGMLRSTKQGENVCVVVARQEDIFLPRELKGEDSNSVVLEDGREQLMYEIPLNETGSAGLGVSLKGNKSRETGEDLGIFIKSIIHGGAAHKDGRLSINDQMIAVNGESLLGRSNHAAMETLRRSMSSEGNARGTIQLVVLRAPRQTQQVSLYPAATTNGSYGHYGNEDEELEEGFPPPPSPEPSAGGALGPTLGLWKSSSLESLQTAVSEAKQSHSQAQVPFHRPRPHMVRGRGCNQSFRIAIDKSYDGPSEDDDDLSEQSSGHETPASSSSRQGLDADDGKKKKKPKDRKKDKKIKGKKKTDDSVEDLDKKTKKKGFGLLRFGKKKEDKSKEAAKASKNKLEALSEEEVDRDGYESLFMLSCLLPLLSNSYDPRYTEIHSGHVTPDSLPDVEDDDSDPNYARINNFRQPPSPQSFISRTPSPAATTAGHHLPQASSEELDGLYAKVNKPRHPAAVQSHDPRYQGLRKEYQPPRAAPVYEELDAARRRVLENDPHRVSVCADPYDYPTHSRPMPRESAPYPIHYQDPLISSHPGRVQSGTHSQQASSNPRYYPSSPHMGLQHRTMVRQDVPPSPPAGHRGRHYYEAAGGRRYTSPERYAYRDERQPNPRRKNPVIGAV
uniref:Partitioning defective 3 homolog B-like n=1 Tax=Seriola lalandi dorsalis TaxID=1841481 RepID=A0A3B4XJV2_SERLL